MRQYLSQLPRRVEGMSETFIKLKRSADTLELLRYPKAFSLAALIALRANRRGPDYSAFSLEKGEALIGDYESCGLTRGEYRWAKFVLERGNFATFRTTNKGTIAKLINSDIFDINIERDDQQNNKLATTKRPSDDHQATTNKNIKELNRNKRTANADSDQEKPESGLLLDERHIASKEEFDDFRRAIKAGEQKRILKEQATGIKTA
jgi:hypothetical protein